MLRRWGGIPRPANIMLLSALRFELDAPGTPCRLLPVLCFTLLQRPGGFMVCVPSRLHASISEDALSDEPLDMLAPCRLKQVPAIEEDDLGEEVLTGLTCPALLLDVEESMLARMAPFDPVTVTRSTSFRSRWRPSRSPSRFDRTGQRSGGEAGPPGASLSCFASCAASAGVPAAFLSGRPSSCEPRSSLWELWPKPCLCQGRCRLLCSSSRHRKRALTQQGEALTRWSAIWWRKERA